MENNDAGSGEDASGVIASVDLRFRSGNSVPVDCARIKIEEWEQVKHHLAARQPVGVEPVVYQVRLSDMTENHWVEVPQKHFDSFSEDEWEKRKLYTVPPAPAAVPVGCDKPNLLAWQLHNQLQHLVRAGRYLEDRVVETRGAKCMDDFDHELTQAEKLLATRPQPEMK